MRLILIMQIYKKSLEYTNKTDGKAFTKPNGDNGKNRVPQRNADLKGFQIVTLGECNLWKRDLADLIKNRIRIDNGDG